MSLDDLLQQLNDGINDSESRRSLTDSAVSSSVAAAQAPSIGARGRSRSGGTVGRLSGMAKGGGGVGGLKGGNPAFASPSQIRNAMAIAQTGKRLGASRRDIVTALTTSLVESNLQNVNYGDRDSLGPFQQRAAWGSAAARTNVRKSAAMFFKGGHGGQQGLFDIGRVRNSRPIGVNAQDVQVSAFPGRYADRVDEARNIIKYITRGRRK
jgi:hypothetical protein